MNLKVLIVSLILMVAIALALAGLHTADDGELVMIGKAIIVIAVVLVAIEVGRDLGE